ncbi:hypothetical protein A3D78_07275 [Candidatus Gottesmanbacteria bacterium RIFCSPHIGHO2_02_FULL_39_14]|uniref:Uncharacterized protein n=2 Tax=Candidatus Gottesmaniibacteriota TaxID=1752720 RepID=A0A1F6A0V2_9BACT|nr:MAG: hypothetical protein A3D78_07275 [Candidatus Gottesmanbacteria bacterium RIFCSPHIGHO2_02_FULL_39_14]OGG32318.1 MAG: hypothetical protein A3I51_02000 [Candidatus Gottesmanbacteria bacterium RIFCSPLOWO2_02_FULL_38_8]
MNDPIGQISPIVKTPGVTINGTTAELTGFIVLLNSVLRVIFIIAGVWAFINIIIAGFSFISAGGDPKKVAQAWQKIWQSFLGLVIIVTSFILAAIIGILLFKDPGAILNPTLNVVK